MYHKYLTICVLSLALFGGARGMESEEDKLIAGHESLQLLPENCGAVTLQRLLGGRFTDQYEFPWRALIARNSPDGLAFRCGGSIINKRYILTAAHCVKNKDIAGVRVGEYNIETHDDCQNNVCEMHLQDLRVEKTIIHENYNGLPNVVNDIALIRVTQDIDFGYKNVDPICLPITSAERQRNLANVMALVSGWGFTETGEESNIPLKVMISILPAENCSSIYNRFSKKGEPDATANQLCAGSQNKDSCNGDSGGPLFTADLSKMPPRYIQYGIVSFGPLRCGSGYPAVYTDVRKYVGWILDHITA